MQNPGELNGGSARPNARLQDGEERDEQQIQQGIHQGTQDQQPIEHAILQQQESSTSSASTTSRSFVPSNLTYAMSNSNSNHQSRNNDSSPPSNRIRRNEPISHSVERTSRTPEQHNNDFNENSNLVVSSLDDDSQTLTPASWSTVQTYGGTPPSERSLHAAAVLNNVLYVFGGYDGFGRVNTFHAYSFAEKRWSPVLPSSHSAPPPSPRDRHVAFAFGNSFYVHGGFDGTSRVSDFWRFDFSSMTWREVMVLDGRSPSPRHSHAAIVHNHSFYCFGGYDGSYKSDLHEFNFDSSEWTAVQASGRRPRARYRATTVVHKNLMILFGGHDGTRHLNDTFTFDLETNAWSNLICDGIVPAPRDSQVAVMHGNSMYIFGGSSGSAMNDLHELQLHTKESPIAKWRAIETSGNDQPSHRFCHVGVVHSESLFVFGGYDGTNRLCDFVKFDISVYDLSFEVPPSTLISEFRAMVDDDTFSDVTILVEGTPIYAHKLLLMRSPYFKALFLGDMRESYMSTVRIEQVSHPNFLQIMEYLYTDQLKIPVESAMELFEAADLFCIPRLKQMCERRILQSINVANAASIFHVADVHSAMALREKVKKYILSHFESVSKSPCFEVMGRSNIELVFELLQSR